MEDVQNSEHSIQCLNWRMKAVEEPHFLFVQMDNYVHRRPFLKKMQYFFSLAQKLWQSIKYVQRMKWWTLMIEVRVFFYNVFI